MSEQKEIGTCALCKSIIYADDSGRVDVGGDIFCSASCAVEATGAISVKESIEEMVLNIDHKPHKVKFTCTKEGCIFVVSKNCGHCGFLNWKILD